MPAFTELGKRVCPWGASTPLICELISARTLSDAYDDNRILLTEDKDFGELVYRLRRPSKGIVLIRIDVEDRQLKKVMLSKLISQYSDRLAGAFVVVETSRFRFRPLTFEV